MQKFAQIKLTVQTTPAIHSQDLSQIVVPTSLYLLTIIKVASKFVGLGCLGMLLKVD